jgi:hypothetical protein
MKYLFLATVFLAAACHKKDAADPKFDEKWAELTKEGTAEPAFIEGDLHGTGLMGEVRRALPPVHEKLGPAGPTFQGPLPDPEVVRVIRSNLAAVKGCYAVEERNGTVGSGKAIVNLEIDPAGTVANVKIDAPAFSGSGLPNCVGARAKSWTFPKFTSGPKKFSYPFVFVGG